MDEGNKGETNMTTITPYSSGSLDRLTQETKRLRRTEAGRAMIRANEQGLVRAVQVNVEERVSGVKLAAAASIGRTAQTEIALLSQMEAQLIQACGSELAAQRIDVIAGITAIGIAELTADGINRVRRM
jgi:hypothetical protein